MLLVACVARHTALFAHLGGPLAAHPFRKGFADFLDKYGHRPQMVRETPRSGDLRIGVAVGAGIARGIARVIRDPSEGARLGQGEILVAPSTDPAWTPLFLRAGGLVMETGGYLSHGAIVAREFAIPAVVNLPGILSEVRDGAIIAVDGSRGQVRIIQ